MGLYYIKLAREDKKDQPKVKNRIITKIKPQPQSHFKFTEDRTKKKTNSIKTEVQRNQDDQKGNKQTKHIDYQKALDFLLELRGG